MIEFFPGDKVRFLNEEGEGIVVAVQGKGVMVQTPDGFEIPYPADKLVKFGNVSERVQKVFNSTSSVEEVLDEHGIFISYLKKVGDSCQGFLINRTSFDLYYSICEMIDGKLKGTLDGMLPSGKFTEVLARYLSQVEKWPQVNIRVLYLGERKILPAPKEFEHKIQAKKFLATNALTPLVNKDGFLFQLDGDEWRIKQKEWKNKLNTIFSKAGDSQDVLDETKVFVPAEIDLHIEAIPDVPKNIGINSILKFQVGYAEKMLDKAIATGMTKITFIHGAGDGVLKREVQELAKRNTHVTSFGKGDPNKYGGGATFLKIG